MNQQDKLEARKNYMLGYNKKNYENKLKTARSKCEICDKEYNTTNRWKHNNTKFHIFFKELIELRGLKPKEADLNDKTI